MKIVTWNCNGALRNKFEHLDEFDADIYIIQECEDPAFTKHEKFNLWKGECLWKGDNKNRGIGVFAKNGTTVKLINWSDVYDDHTVKHFLPCIVNDNFQLLNIWATTSETNTFNYIGQLWKYLEINKKHFQKIILAGDFNSNKIWDRSNRTWNHSDVVNNLSELKIKSLYHTHFKEAQGKEINHTFFLHRNKQKPYHLDYVFASKEILKKMTNFEIANLEKWLTLSDHLPIICDFKNL